MPENQVTMPLSSKQLKKALSLGKHINWKIKQLTQAFKVGIPKSTIHNDALKKGLLKHNHKTIRPVLADKNKADRVGYCCSFVLEDGQFTDMLERVDVDK
jgi:hypothetical protein